MFLFVILFCGIFPFHSDLFHYPTDGGVPSSGVVGISTCVLIIGLVIYIAFFFYRLSGSRFKGKLQQNIRDILQMLKPLALSDKWFIGMVTRYASSQATSALVLREVRRGETRKSDTIYGDWRDLHLLWEEDLELTGISKTEWYASAEKWLNGSWAD